MKNSSQHMVGPIKSGCIISMTEEDTFNKLRRIPFSEMLDIVDSVSPRVWFTLLRGTNRELDLFLKPYGWTSDEYLEEWIGDQH